MRTSERARALFRARFGREPDVVAIAPGRINLIGEHVDYAEGIVLPCAIERSTAVAAGGHDVTIVRSESHGEATFRLRDEPAPFAGDDAWANYLLGPLALLRAGGIAVPELALAVASDLPAGGGLASSAALEVATALAMLKIAGASMDASSLAALCREAEHRYAGTPCGPMDMTTVLEARAGEAIRLDCRDGSIERVPMPERARFVVVDSGVRHRLSAGGYAERRSEVTAASSALGLRSLRDATIADVERLEGTLAARARHVVSEIARTIEAAQALKAGDLERTGALMTESHASLRDDFEVSIPELDAIVEEALALPGVFGARLTGGGFGGCAIVLVERDRAEAVGAALGRGRTWFATRAVQGAYVFSHGCAKRQF